MYTYWLSNQDLFRFKDKYYLFMQIKDLLFDTYGNS